MAVLKINNLSIMEKTSSYSISRQDISRSFEAENGDTKSYITRKGRYTIDLKLVCDGAFYSQLETVLGNDELTVSFTYAGSGHTAYMIKKSYKSSCETLDGSEYWSISLSLAECRRTKH